MPPEILFGKDAALEGKMYVRFENAKDIFLVGKRSGTTSRKSRRIFAIKKLTDLTTRARSRASC